MQVTDNNKGKIDEVIHKYVGEQPNYGRYSADWRKAAKKFKKAQK